MRSPRAYLIYNHNLGTTDDGVGVGDIGCVGVGYIGVGINCGIGVGDIGGVGVEAVADDEMGVE